MILRLFQALGLSAKEVETMLYKKSGLVAISGTSNDMRDLVGSNDPAAVLAVDYFVYRAVKEIGSLAAVLEGLAWGEPQGRWDAARRSSTSTSSGTSRRAGSRKSRHRRSSTTSSSSSGSTNGYYGDRLSDAELGALDLVLLGIKSWGAERHKDLTGMDITPTLEFARRLAAVHKPVWIRFVLVPGLTDDPEILEGIAGFAAGLGKVERVEVLPFHQMGRFKWERLGLDYTLGDTQPPTPDACEQACEVFRAQGLKAY